jgi:hypothetical protein
VIEPVLVIAHQGGWDEMAIFLFPVVFGVGLWWIVKRPAPVEEDEDDSENSRPAEG